MTSETTHTTNTKPISNGQYLLYRKDGRKLKRPGIIGSVVKAHAPTFRHPTYEAAEAEAKRLLSRLPDSTFIILREVGRVKSTGQDA